MVSCCGSYTIPAYIWAILSILSAFLTPLGIYFSNWLELTTSDGHVSSLSSFRRCINETQRITVSCEDYLYFDAIYSPAWQAVTILFGIGACLQILVALTALFGFCIKHLFNVCVVGIIVSAQVVEVLLYVTGIFVFPVGWDAPQVKQVCGPTTSVYNSGNCTVGWAFIIIIIGTFISTVAAFISWTPALKRNKEERHSSYTI